MSEDNMTGAFERAGQIASAIDTRELDAAFAGLSHAAQWHCYKVLAEPHRRVEPLH